MFPDEIRVWADGRCDPIMIRHRTRAHPFARKHVNSTQAGKPGFDQPEWLERAVGVCGARTHASEHAPDLFEGYVLVRITASIEINLHVITHTPLDHVNPRRYSITAGRTV